MSHFSGLVLTDNVDISRAVYDQPPQFKSTLLQILLFSFLVLSGLKLSEFTLKYSRHYFGILHIFAQHAFRNTEVVLCTEIFCVCVCVCVSVCVCISVLETTFLEWLSGTEPLPHTPGAVRPSSCL